MASQWTAPLDGETLPDRQSIGGKAWSVAHMVALGLPVPPAFVLTTQAHAKYREEGRLWPRLLEEVDEGIRRLEASTNRYFGGSGSPLLVSVRSGAAISMPGMMDTVLNLGINDSVEKALALECGDSAFASDTHRRFLALFSDIVLKAEVSVEASSSPDAIRDALRDRGFGVPAEPREQLHAAIEAVFQSWNSRRARKYRDHHGISHDLGTAVTIQAMVFGNLNSESGTGVLFSRNPLTGERTPFGEFLQRAQGEDVVSGKFTPEPLDAMHAKTPAAHAQLLQAAERLEESAREVQDIEFTIESGRLFILQSRTAKLAPLAAARTSVELVNEGKISPEAALKRISTDRLRQLLAPTLASATVALHRPLAHGEGACPGVGIGIVVTDADEAERRIKHGDKIVLARPTTSPNDLHGMIGAVAVVTEEGGSTSHAAVVSRALGIPCVVGCGPETLMPLVGRTVTVDGRSGDMFAGGLDVQVVDERADSVLRQLHEWANERSSLRVIRNDEIGHQVVIDLAADAEACDPDTIDAALGRLLRQQPASGARGGAIATDIGVRAAMGHGLQFIVADPVLPPLLAAALASSP